MALDRPEPHRNECDTGGKNRRFEDLAGAIRELLSIPGVEDIGQPVTLISPGDLPMDMLAFVERLRGGFIEVDEEMLLITIPESSVRGRRPVTDPTVERIRDALIILCRYATTKGLAPFTLRTLLEALARDQLPDQDPPG